jgi:hypothetical protein
MLKSANASENPRVDGSIPSLATIHPSPDFGPALAIALWFS